MSVAELKDALRDSLERRGVYGELKAKIRSELFATLQDADDVRPTIPEANIVLNELIREYLAFNGYNHALSVFVPEAKCGAAPLPRSLLATQTRLPQKIGGGLARGDLPLLYALTPSRPDPSPTQTGSAPTVPRHAANAPAAVATQSLAPTAVPFAVQANEMPGTRMPAPTPVIFAAPPSY